MPIERAGNRIDDVLPGVTIDLYQADPGAELAVKIEPSLVAAKERLVGFVAAYNELRDFVARHSTVGAGGQVGEDAVLFGDRTLRALAQSLGGLVGGAVPGLAPGALSTLRDVGISLEGGGRLRIDEATLDSRLLTRLEDVRGVFEFTATASSGDLAVYARTNALSDLAFTVAVTDADADGRAEAATLDGVPAIVDGGMIEGAPGTAYEGLKLIWTGQGNATIDLSVSQGLADQLYNAHRRGAGPGRRPAAALARRHRGHQRRLCPPDRADRPAGEPGARAADRAAQRHGIRAQPRQHHAHPGPRPDGRDEPAKLRGRMSPVPLHLRASAAYRDAEAHPPARQIVLLHDSAIRNLEEARSAIGAKRIEARFNRVTKAHAIVAALQSCLDFDRGGEVAQVLDRLYGHILNRLMLINLHNDPTICDELVLLLERMRVGWAELASGPLAAPGAPAGLPTALSA